MSNVPSKPHNDENITIKDVQIRFENFRGIEDPYNRAGARNFSIMLREDEALMLQNKGYNVKTREGREPGDPSTYTLKMNLQFNTKGRPPRVVMVTSKNKTSLDESNVGILDNAVITSADVLFRGYEYEPGKLSAYIIQLFANIEESELEDRYAHIPEQGMSAQSSTPRFDEYGN